jgi:hypothetical protein
LVLDDARHVFIEVFFEFWRNQGKPAFNCEDSLNVDLGIGVGHVTLHSAPKGAMRDEKAGVL